jgi:predicted DNA-binding transcriptional regulator YafY
MPAKKVDSLVVAREARRLAALPFSERPASLVEALAETFDCSPRTISRQLKAEGVVFRVAKHEVPELSELRERYLVRGETAAEIAFEKGVSIRTVERWLHDAELRKQAVQP